MPEELRTMKITAIIIAENAKWKSVVAERHGKWNMKLCAINIIRMLCLGSMGFGLQRRTEGYIKRVAKGFLV